MDLEADANLSASVSKRRQKQLKSANFLASDLLGRKIDIKRDNAGRPHLVGSSYNLSISHTGDWMCLIVNENKSVAIDIERLNRQVGKVKFKFTTDKELDKVQSIFDANPDIFLWSCKECLFKILPFEGILFKEQLQFDNLIEIKANDVFVTRWKVLHEQFYGFYKINSFIFEGLLISYIDEDAEVSTE